MTPSDGVGTGSDGATEPGRVLEGGSLRSGTGFHPFGLFGNRLGDRLADL